MKKLLIGALCAVGVITVASAQSTVQLAGAVDVYAGRIQMAGDARRTSVVNSGGLTTSWFGVKGSEDLGGGLKANFALSSFLRADTGMQGRFAGDTFFSREATVGLSGGFGSLTLGRGLAPNFLPTVVLNPFGDSFTFSPLVVHKNVPLFNGTGWGATTPSDTGWSNQAIYSTPEIGGLRTNLHYQFGEIAGQSGKKNVGVNALYFSGPMALGAYYERNQVTNPVPVAFALGDTRTDWMLGGSFDFTAVKTFATYGQSKAAISTTRAKSYSLGLASPLGSGKILAGLARTRVVAGNTRNTLSLGYDYNLSRRTDVYVIAMRDRITTFNSGSSLATGIRHRF
ncbi:MAG: porin [Rhodoferax sp.]|nr:porin [Rhodoferax sp.]MDP3653305.1 porin [Rhodoferax sp.]